MAFIPDDAAEALKSITEVRAISEIQPSQFVKWAAAVRQIRANDTGVGADAGDVSEPAPKPGRSRS